jgi:hypothetical protein
MILFTESPNIGIATFTPVSFLAFITYFCVQFLNLDITTKLISMKKQVSSLESSQKELKQLATSLYKISLLNTVSRGLIGDLVNFSKEHDKIVSDIEKYIDEDEIALFAKILEKIRKNPY